MLIPTFHKSTLSRVVGLLLVFFILYGTTVEAAHKHGRVVSKSGAQASLTTPGSSQHTRSTNAGCNDCLTCQLHQHLFASLVSAGMREEVPAPRLLLSESGTFSITSFILAPQAGRAPPQVN